MASEELWDDSGAARGWDRINDALDEIRSDDHGRYSPPNDDDVLRHGELDTVAREQYIAEVVEQAEADADDGLLLGDRNRSQSLESLLEEVGLRMHRVAGARGEIIKDIRTDIKELEQLADESEALTDTSSRTSGSDAVVEWTQEVTDYQDDLSKAQLDVDLAEGRERNMSDVFAPPRWARVTMLVGAAAALVIDVLFVKTALLEQRARGLGDLESLVLAIVIALVLAVVAYASGHYYARGIVDRSINPDEVPDSLEQHYNNLVEERASEARRSRVLGLSLGVFALIVFLVLGAVRVNSVATEGGSLALALLWIGVALVGLGMLAAEAFFATRVDMKERAAEIADFARERRDAVSMMSKADPELRDRAEALGALIPDKAVGSDGSATRTTPIDQQIGHCLDSIDRHFVQRVFSRYQAAAIGLLETLAPDDERRKQIQRFRDLQPEDMEYTTQVTQYLDLVRKQSAPGAGLTTGGTS